MYEEAALKTSINANVCTALRWRQLTTGLDSKGQKLLPDDQRHQQIQWTGMGD